MRRRDFIGLASATAWPLAARAQQGERVRRVGVLLGLVANDPEGQARLARFQQAAYAVDLAECSGAWRMTCTKFSKGPSPGTSRFISLPSSSLISLKTARALGLTLSPALLAHAVEVIE